MPINTTILDGIIYTELSGEIDLDAIITYSDFIFSLKDKLVSRYELHDHTNTKSINLSSEDISQIAAYSIKTEGIFQHTVLAVYATGDYTFGIARMFEMVFEVEDRPITVEIFRNKEDALQFLISHMDKHG